MKNSEVRELLRQMQEAGAEFTTAPDMGKPDFIVASEKCMVPGSRKVVCDGCLTALFMYDGFGVLEHYPGVPVLCLRCAAAHAKNYDKGNP